MKIAVCYEDGKVFQHFGKTENFKIYEVSDGKIISSKVISSNGAGHEALAVVLANSGADVLICGGLGAGAQEALSMAGIQVMSGAQGDADEAVNAFLAGELVSTGVNCDHHDHEEEHSCGHDCGGCHGCGHHEVIYEGKNAGKSVKVHYRGTFNDGSEFDSSYKRNEPLEFIAGVGMMIPGFDKAVVDMNIGDEIDIHLMPEEAYGMPDPNAIFTVEITQMPGSEEVKVGDQVYLTNMIGQPFPAVVTAKDETTVTFDTNSEMAGKELIFHIELLQVQ